MGTANSDAVRAGYAAFAGHDTAALDALFADDVVWHVAGRSPIAGTYKGKDELFGGFFAGLAERSGGTFATTVETLVAEGDQVVAVTRQSGRREGRTLSTRDVLVFRFVGSRVAEVRLTSFDLYENDAFWS